MICPVSPTWFTETLAGLTQTNGPAEAVPVGVGLIVGVGLMDEVGVSVTVGGVPVIVGLGSLVKVTVGVGVIVGVEVGVSGQVCVWVTERVFVAGLGAGVSVG